QAEDGIRDFHVTGVQTCALPICNVLISRTWVEERRLDWTGESALFQSKVEGLFPRKDADPNVVVPLSFVSPCRFLDLPEGEPVEIGRASCRERVGLCGGG